MRVFWGEGFGELVGLLRGLGPQAIVGTPGAQGFVEGCLWVLGCMRTACTASAKYGYFACASFVLRSLGLQGTRKEIPQTLNP